MADPFASDVGRPAAVSSGVAVGEPARAAAPPRRIAWVLLLASASAVLVTGVLGTMLVLGQLAGSLEAVAPRFWMRLPMVAGLTVASLLVRSLRWVFLLRRAQMRIPIRDAYVGYFAGLSLLLAPFLLGEIAVRAVVHRARGGVPVSITAIVNLWERLLDLVALGLIAGVFALARGRVDLLTLGLLAAVAATLLDPVRQACLRIAVAVTRPVGRLFDEAPLDASRLAGRRAWGAALTTSVAAWLLPGMAFWYIAGAWGRPFDMSAAQHAYASSSGLGGLVLAPGGVLVAGGHLLNVLEAAGFPALDAALTVFGIRLATVGVATVLGGVYLFVHLRTPVGRGEAAGTVGHFDEIADAYDVQIPESRREALLTRKTELMRQAIERHGRGRRGLDAGCGQGAYVAHMRRLGFDVRGIDASAGQVRLAARRLGADGTVTIGSLPHVPDADASYDFVYTINVLHHLESIEEQRRAFAELLRVLRPGGLLLVHEINTRNILFRFYMGYVFPSLNCIDEGVERWLLPHRMAMYTEAGVVDLRYFTFLPEFVPQALVRLLAPLERLLEASPLRVFSAHYMAVLQKPR
jgi:2-polyprenyl-3-methyl-5-hydroxy-6-metoxy-1,4-benzoquinol methylase/uncharacterized membrane protein YbhN (UPF0104 family)